NVEVVDEEVRVFEVAENREIRDDADGEPAAPLVNFIARRDSRGTPEVDDADDQQQREVAVIPRRVKERRARAEHEFFTAMRHRNRGGAEDGGEEGEEADADETHRRIRSSRASTSAAARWPSTFRWPRPKRLFAKPYGALPRARNSANASRKSTQLKCAARQCAITRCSVVRG